MLASPTAALDDTVPARRAITLRHLLTNTSGYGMVLATLRCSRRWPTTTPKPASTR